MCIEVMPTAKGDREMKKRINVTLEEHILHTVDRLAKERGIDRSTMISILIYDSANIIELRDVGDSVENSIDTLGEPL